MKQIIKYVSIWTTCLYILATLPSAVLKDDKVVFWAQEMYTETMAPLATLLENMDDENFTIKEAIPMVVSHSTATKHHSSLRRKVIMQHFNPLSCRP